MKKILPILSFLLAFAGPLSSAAPSPVFESLSTSGAQAELPAGTIVHLEVTERLSSGSASIGQLVNCKVKAHVVVNGKVVIRTGAIGLARVKNIRRTTYNDPEEITIEAVSVQAADGQQLKLNGSEQTIRGQFSNQPSVLQIGTPLIANVMNNSSILVD